MSELSIEAPCKKKKKKILMLFDTKLKMAL